MKKSQQQQQQQQQQQTTSTTVVQFPTMMKNSSNTILHSSTTRVALSLLGIVLTPLLFYAKIPTTDPVLFASHIMIGWAGLLHFSCLPIAVVTFAMALLLAHACSSATCGLRFLKHRNAPTIACLALTVFFTVSTVLSSQLQLVAPSWIWNPFLLFNNFRIYHPDEIQPSIHGVCVDYQPSDVMREPLCLSPDSWENLSSGSLSSERPQDVANVLNGIKYAKDVSGGLVINVMSRDTIDAIEPLRMNVEGLLPFFPDNKLAVVVFENDSKDGTRDAFKRWASEAVGYTVDLMTCGDENPDCKFGFSHRYDTTEAKEYFKSSAIGKMAEFRQRMSDYITTEEKYKDYSHMIVMDLDLGVSISPLGILHSLGTVPDSAVASSGRQVWPGSAGTIIPPYDFSAFRPLETPVNENLISLHQKFCELMPAGDRWRNMCDAASPMQLMMILSHDWLSHNEPYQVASAFNGATMYPLQLVKETHAQYDVGDDGQRCEHIGYNLGLQEPMYVNPKWTMNVNPKKPGGPTGTRALKNLVRIVFTPRISLIIFFQNISCMAILVCSVMVLGLHVGNQLTSLTSSRTSSSSYYNNSKSKIELPLFALDDNSTSSNNSNNNNDDSSSATSSTVTVSDEEADIRNGSDDETEADVMLMSAAAVRRRNILISWRR